MIETIKKNQEQRYRQRLKAEENKLFIDYLPSYLTLISIFRLDCKKIKVKPPEEFESYSEYERKLWVTRQMAELYLPEQPNLEPNELDLEREVFSRGYLEMSKPSGGSLKPIAGQLGIGWGECINIFRGAMDHIAESMLKQL